MPPPRFSLDIGRGSDRTNKLSSKVLRFARLTLRLFSARFLLQVLRFLMVMSQYAMGFDATMYHSFLILFSVYLEKERELLFALRITWSLIWVSFFGKY